jgi:hypothetical protein
MLNYIVSLLVSLRFCHEHARLGNPNFFISDFERSVLHVIYNVSYLFISDFARRVLHVNYSVSYYFISDFARSMLHVKLKCLLLIHLRFC